MRVSTDKLLVFAWLLAFWRSNCVTVISSLTGVNASLLNLVWFVMVVGITVLAEFKGNLGLKRGLLALVVMLLFYLISILLSCNEMGMEYLRNFILYVVLGAFLVTQLKDIEYALTMYCYSCLIAFFAFAFLPFTGSLEHYNNMAYFGTGMVYGESVIAPCFMGLYILYKRNDKKIYFVLSGLCIILGFFLANRSTILVCLFFVLLYMIWVEKINRKKILFLFTLIASAIVLIYNLSTILTWLINILSRYDINSYALNKYSTMLASSERLNFSSGRDDIYNIGIQYFLENPIFGLGFGGFYEKTGIPYVHNIVIDWFSTLGIIGGIIMLGMTTKALWNMFHVHDRTTKIALCILLGLWFPRMMFSKTFADDIEYWMFMVYALSLMKIRGTKRYVWPNSPGK